MKESQLVLHGLAIKNRGRTCDVAEITGLDVATVQRALDKALAAGRVAQTGDSYMLLPAARVALKASYAREFAAERADGDMQATYDAFETINRELKALISDWQMMTVGGTKVSNDHTDAAYDAKVIERLGDLDQRVEPMLDRFARALPRLAAYKRLLTRALEKAEDGDGAWISDARCMSYHTTWFALHEDLIRVMGRAREG